MRWMNWTGWNKYKMRSGRKAHSSLVYNPNAFV